MPTVPRYSEPTIDIRPVSNVQTSYKPVVEQALVTLGNSMSDLSGQVMKQVNEKALFDYRTGLDQIEGSLAFGDDEFEGFNALRGKDPVDRLEAYLEDYDQRIGKLKESARNPAQRNAFDMLAQDRRVKIETSFRRHASTEFNRSVDDSLSKMMDSSLKMIGNYYNDDQRFNSELQMITGAIMSDSENKGEDQSQTKFRVDTMLSAAHTARLARLMEVDPLKANEYLTLNKDQMDSHAVGQFEHAIKPKLVAMETTGQADEIWKEKGPQSAYEPIDIQAMEDRAREKIKGNPDLLKSVLADIEHRANVRNATEKETLYNLKGDVYQQYYVAGASLAQVRAGKEFALLPAQDQAEVVHKLVGEQRADAREQRAEESAIRAEIRAARSDARSGRAELRAAQQQQWDLNYYDVSNDPDRLAGMSDGEFKSSMAEVGPGNWKRLEVMRRKMTSPEALAQAKIESSLFNSLMTDMKIKDKGQQSTYKQKFENYLVALQKDEKRVLRPDEIRQALVASTQTVEVNQRVSPLGIDALSYSSSTKKRLIDVQNMDALVVPKSENEAIGKLLAGAGIKDTPERRRKMYRAILGERGTK